MIKTRKGALVGERFGRELQLEVVETPTKDIKKYRVLCHICKNDEELFGDGKFYSDLSNLRKDSPPCGCGKGHRWSRQEYLVKIARSLEGTTRQLVSMSDDFKGGLTRCSVICKIDGHTWDISIDNLIRGKGCPKCMRLVVSNNFKKEDSVIVSNFLSTGKFLEGTTFTRSERVNKRGHALWWNMVCPICSFDDKVLSGCCSGIFESTCGNLGCGYLPCRCSKHGFQKSKQSSLYVIRAVSDSSQFTGYGITNNIDNRIRTHRKNLLNHGFVISEMEVFEMYGELAQKLELSIKQNFVRDPQKMEGFKTEATLYHLYMDILSFIEDNLG